MCQSPLTRLLPRYWPQCPVWPFPPVRLSTVRVRGTVIRPTYLPHHAAAEGSPKWTPLSLTLSDRSAWNLWSGTSRTPRVLWNVPVFFTDPASPTAPEPVGLSPCSTPCSEAHSLGEHWGADGSEGGKREQRQIVWGRKAFQEHLIARPRDIGSQSRLLEDRNQASVQGQDQLVLVLQSKSWPLWATRGEPFSK